MKKYERNRILAREVALVISLLAFIILLLILIIFSWEIKDMFPNILTGGYKLSVLFTPLNETPEVNTWNIVWFIPLITFNVTYVVKMYLALNSDDRSYERTHLWGYGFWGGIIVGGFWGFLGMSPIVFIGVFTPIIALAAIYINPEGNFVESLNPIVVMTVGTAALIFVRTRGMSTTELIAAIEIVALSFTVNTIANSVRPFILAVRDSYRGVRYKMRRKKRQRRIALRIA